MQVLQAEVRGFCFGVRRAIELAEAALSDDKIVNTLGPLVHNPQEIARLAAAGILAVDTPDCVKTKTVVIRAHGARKDTIDALRQRKLHLVDATCPFVKKSQRIAQELEQQGYTLVIVGHPDHPEVQGILGYVSTPAFVITQAEDIATLPGDIHPGVIAQTTVNEKTFFDVIATLAKRFPEYTVHNTVCSATRERQEAARKLAEQVAAIYVVGGRHSSNTNRLAEICRAVCPQTFLIETAEEIRSSQLAGITSVGVTAGASTPDWLIEQVVKRLQQIPTPCEDTSSENEKA
ncbi:MAG TPA: 4-hydroxy-3-methylbut-2-enyl diphosphate reductase [Armatimonadota bacterium]|nr:4-hydroxy-3-methylbut-2-enyl diphosphate reductase [Armatimonadota bacterium]